MKNDFRRLIGGVIALASIVVASPSFADTDTCNTMKGQVANGKYVYVTECDQAETKSGGYFHNSYQVQNHSDVSIWGFMVSTGATGYGKTTTGTSRIGWESDYLGKAEWDGRSDLGGKYGLFASLFGTDDQGVFRYNKEKNENGKLISVGEETGEQFFFDQVLSSEFIALDENQSIIARSYSAPSAQIPEPGSLMLLGLGLAGLAASRRKLTV